VEIDNADSKTQNKKNTTFYMGETKEQKKVSTQVSCKTYLIKQAGGYGGFIRAYKRNPFETSDRQAKGIYSKKFGRNKKCFCGSEIKFKKCCLNDKGM